MLLCLTKLGGDQSLLRSGGPVFNSVGTFIHSTTTYNLCNLLEFAKFEVSTPLHFGHNSVVSLLIPEFGMNSKVLELQNEN